MLTLTTAADHLLADLFDADLSWDDVEGLLTVDVDERESIAATHVAERAAELCLGLSEDELEDETAALVEVLTLLADMGVDSMFALQGALAVLAGSPARHAA